MALTVFTIVHVLISLVGIAAGFMVIRGMLGDKPLPGWTKIFLTATMATSVTGFMFPYHGFTPAIGFGIISLLILALAIHSLVCRRLAGGWRKVYVITALTAQYLNVFVLVVQLFQKVPALKALAPTQSEPPFAIVQALVLTLFVVLGISAVKRFRGAP